MTRILSVLILTAALAACASAPAPTPAPASAPAAAKAAATPQQTADAEQACRREFPTQSTIAVTRCRNKEQAAADQASVDRTRDGIRDTARPVRDPLGSSR